MRTRMWSSGSMIEPVLPGPGKTPRSDAEAREVAFQVAQPGYGGGREHTAEHLRCIGGKGKRRGRRVLFEAADVARVSVVRVFETMGQAKLREFLAHRCGDLRQPAADVAGVGCQW